MATVAPVVRFVSIAYWSHAESIIRRSLRILVACERLRARRNPGTAIAANNAMIATTIIISTRVKPPRRLLSLFIIFGFSCLFDCVFRDLHRRFGLYKAALMPSLALVIITRT